MMKRIASFIPLGILLACSTALPSLGATVERQNIRLFKIIENTASSGSKSFRIRGVSNGSLGVCGKRKSRFKNNILSVEIPKVFISKGLKTSHFFDVTITAAATVKQILFGKNREQVWPVDKGNLKLTVEEEEAQVLATRDFLEKHPGTDIRDFSIQIDRATTKVVLVNFFEWSGGRPCRASKYAIDVSKKTILNLAEVSLAP